ncbi:MAG: fibronectin type III domain-containing protein [Lachnospiraceae bacterium]|nr:fibronectin type III domain-containing protein [Lachnospiraceae bacterium]
MKKKKVTKFLSVILAFACIVSTWPKIHVFAEKSSVEANENVVIQEEFKEPQGGVLPDEAIPVSEEEAQEIHENFQEIQGVESYAVPQVNTSFVSNYGYSTLTTSQEQSCYAEIKTKAYQFHEQQPEAVLKQSKDSSGNVVSEYYIWAEFLVSEYGLTVSQVQKVIFAIEADCPELFWFSGSFGYGYNSENIVTKIYPKVEADYAEVEARKEAQNNIEAGIQPYLVAIDQAKAEGADDMEMELLIHDMILEAVDYEYIPGTRTPQSAAYAHSIVGLFQQRGVVCEGYAKGFHMLMTYAGIDTIYAVGYGNGGGHAWNLVCLDGIWYNIDITWNDPDNKVPHHDGIIYRFYNCSSDFFGNHVYMPTVFKGMYEVPETNADTCNYYHYYGLYVTPEKVSGETAFVDFMTNALKKAADRGDYLLQFAFDSLITRESFKECVTEYGDEFLAAINNSQSVYKISGTGTYISGSPYNVYFPIVKIYADTYEVEDDGTEAELTFHIIKGRREVAQEENYQINYLDNDKVGEAKAIVTGLGAYEFLGSNEFTFQITEKSEIVVTPEPTKELFPTVDKVSGLKLVSANANSVTIRFTKQSSVKGYEVVLYQGNKEKQRVLTTKNTYKLKKLSTAADYKVKVRAYTKKDDEVIFGAYSSPISVGTATKAPVITSIKKGEKHAVIQWKKVKKASGYEIYMSSKKNSGYKKTATVKKVSAVKYTKKKLKAGKKYYFKVRTYRTVKGKKIYSSYSKVKSTKL